MCNPFAAIAIKSHRNIIIAKVMDIKITDSFRMDRSIVENFVSAKVFR
jgi:hypothetical protein